MRERVRCSSLVDWPVYPRGTRGIARRRDGDPTNPTPAEEALQAALGVARKQGTRIFEIRAALSLARLNQSTGCPADAHAVLAPALEGVSPTPEMPEIAEAQALLAALVANEPDTAELRR
jgi:hypothetical protein